MNDKPVNFATALNSSVRVLKYSRAQFELKDDLKLTDNLHMREVLNNLLDSAAYLCNVLGESDMLIALQSMKPIPDALQPYSASAQVQPTAEGSEPQMSWKKIMFKYHTAMDILITPVGASPITAQSIYLLKQWFHARFQVTSCKCDVNSMPNYFLCFILALSAAIEAGQFNSFHSELNHWCEQVLCGEATYVFPQCCVPAWEAMKSAQLVVPYVTRTSVIIWGELYRTSLRDLFNWEYKPAALNRDAVFDLVDAATRRKLKQLIAAESKPVVKGEAK